MSTSTVVAKWEKEVIKNIELAQNWLDSVCNFSAKSTGANAWCRSEWIQATVPTWKKIVDDPGLPFKATILVDADIPLGHAYVEVSGARVDLGLEARKALIRSALDLDGSIGQDDESATS